MGEKAIQDLYGEWCSHCYGCGRLNENGLQIKSFWEGDTCVCRFTPRPYHTAIPGFVYGGLLASLVDCHSTGTAAAAAFRAAGAQPGTEADFRFVTASLHVDYLKPTPLGPEITLVSRPVEVKGKKVVVETDVLVQGQTCAKGRVVAVMAPDSMKINKSSK